MTHPRRDLAGLVAPRVVVRGGASAPTGVGAAATAAAPRTGGAGSSGSPPPLRAGGLALGGAGVERVGRPPLGVPTPFFFRAATSGGAPAGSAVTVAGGAALICSVGALSPAGEAPLPSGRGMGAG
jgi:hypothetical protein